ncbi:MAG TPA: GAF domain-containing SpoIIE family protein phosphatase, partial [Bacteroidota bacterium]|nr:GAF domain-containing SpoIIE family protein phosphatase [Bacteroidota bacterium]
EQVSVGQKVAIERPLRSIASVAKLRATERAWVDYFAMLDQELVIPIFSQRKVVGIITIGSKLSGVGYSSSEKQLIQSLVNLSGAAIEKAMIIEQLKEANRNIDHKYQELNTLFDLSKEFNVGLDVTKVVRLITFALLGQVGVNRYAICLRNGDELQIIASKLEGEINISETLKPLCGLKKAELIQDLLRQRQLRAAAFVLHQAGISAIIPMHLQGQTKGAILLGPRLRGGEYTAADLEFLYSLGNLAIISIENARLFREALEKQRMEDELKIAREIQQGLLPEQLPKIPGFEIAGINIPSFQVGGDYYDVIEHSDHDFVVAIGDVSGKGTPAALLMAGVQAVLRTIAPLRLPLPVATGRMNELICLNTHGGKFITFFWGILETGRRLFRFVNAGHNPPMLVRKDGSVQKLEDGGLILGIMKSVSPYQEGAITFESGDILLMYTDGVSEAMNPEQIDFSEEALERVVVSSRNLSAGELIGQIRQALERHTKGSPQSDDITMLVLKAL